MLLICATMAQRGSYAGVRPISNGIKGEYPTQATLNQDITNRFGGSDSQQVPSEFTNNIDLANRVSQLPYNQQPFWYLNAHHIEAHRNQPQFSGSVHPQQGSFSGRR